MELLLRQIDLLIFAEESGRGLTDAELTLLHDHQTIWRRDLDRIRNRLASVTIEPSKPDSVKKALGRGEGRTFTLVPKTEDGIQRWALMERRNA